MDEAIKAVADDIAETTGLHGDIEIGEDENGSFIAIASAHGSTISWGPIDATVIAQQMQEQHVIEELGRAWPRCLKHGRHPMVPSGGSWTCDGEALVAIGSLTEEGPDPHVEDGRVRWYLDGYGFGAIAHHDGDLWFHFSAIQMEGFKALPEDALVEFEVSRGRQGAYRRADVVRPVR